jgi:hypothetical protein
MLLQLRRIYSRVTIVKAYQYLTSGISERGALLKDYGL